MNLTKSLFFFGIRIVAERDSCDSETSESGCAWNICSYQQFVIRATPFYPNQRMLLLNSYFLERDFCWEKVLRENISSNFIAVLYVVYSSKYLQFSTLTGFFIYFYITYSKISVCQKFPCDILKFFSESLPVENGGQEF